MTVPDETIEAAAKSMFASHPVSKGAFPWDAHPEGRIKQQFRADARAALEAAAPYLRAQALEDAAQLVTPDIDPELCTTIYDPWDVADWLRARAAAERGPDV